MMKETVLKWIEWRYPDVWKDFKKFASHHVLYDKSKPVQEQAEHVIETIMEDYVHSFDLIFTGMRMNKNTKRLFSHINILLR
jgi:hypothetical protein